MTRILFLLLLSIYGFTNLFAQVKAPEPNRDKQVLAVAVPQISNRHFFDKNSELKNIALIYKDGKPYYVMLAFFNKGYDYDRYEHYDLMFEGDNYLLNDKYGLIDHVKPEVYFHTASIRDTSTAFIISSTAIYRDTVFYRFFQQWPGMEIKKTNPEGIVGMPAKYKGNLEDVGTKIAKQLKAAENAGVTDSTLVFQGTISKNGKLEALELVVGQASALSEITEEVLLGKDSDISTGGERYEWNAANIDRGPIESKARIYVKLEPEGKVTIKTPRVLRTFTGL